VVLGNVGTAGDVDVPTRALDDPEPLVREHAAWALRRIASAAVPALPADAALRRPGAAEPPSRRASEGIEPVRPGRPLERCAPGGRGTDRA
jgi:hypothetical protein